MTERTRRQFVAAGAALGTAASAGCLGVFEKKPMALRALPAEGDETDVKCTLSSEFVSRYPKLERVLSRAQNNDDWATMGVSLETGNAIGDALVQHCEGQTRGLYEYEGEWYFVSLRYRDAADHQAAESGHHGNDTANESGHGDHEHTH